VLLDRDLLLTMRTDDVFVGHNSKSCAIENRKSTAIENSSNLISMLYFQLLCSAFGGTGGGGGNRTRVLKSAKESFYARSLSFIFTGTPPKGRIRTNARFNVLRTDP